MKRKEFYQLIQPLSEKLYRLAFALVPDDLQTEQLVVDALNAYLIKEKKNILQKALDLEQKKETQVYRRIVFKGLLRHLSEIGLRRSQQLMEQMRLTRPEEFKAFYALEPKVRFVISLRYDAMFSAEEIGEILQMPRYEVIEKIHNGRFLLTHELQKGMNV